MLKKSRIPTPLMGFAHLGAVHAGKTGEQMHALSIRQDFASLIAVGEKTIEWRSWHWAYRGPLIICATKNPKIKMENGVYLPTAAAICIVDMVDCRPFTRADLYAACISNKKDGSDFADDVDGYAFVLENAREVEPVPVKGRLRPWIWHGPKLVPAPGWHAARYGEKTIF
ncbi:MAG: ASCH domain-containing protein [Deltaproteobacteria bacterium]|jgi:hypothetical protein|nr:ASCH domain-containing protein [Deltaproteobacteria bacterium]